MLVDIRSDALRRAASLQPLAQNKTVQTSLRAVTRVELYIAMLYMLLRQLQQCFFSGAFVVEDREQTLLKLLLRARHRERYPGRTKAGTHRAFMRGMDCQKWRLAETASVCGRQFEILLPSLTLTCETPNGSIVHDKRNVLLFYGFLGPDLAQQTSNPVHYVYMKLETSSYASLSHAISASVHYGRKALKIGDKESVHGVQQRREGKKSSNVSSQRDYELYKCDAVQRRAQMYDKVRRGDEFFVPQMLNEAFLQRVQRVLPTSALSLDTCAAPMQSFK